MAEKLASKIASLGTGSKTAVVQASVVEKAGQQTLVDTALNLGLHQNIDILVHNAGNGDDRYLQDITEDFYQMQMDINVKGKPAPPYAIHRPHWVFHC